jgi:arylsulfatase A-like enzyme
MRWANGTSPPAFVGGPGDDGSLKETWPRQRGFDHYYGYMGGWTDQWHPKLVDENTPIAAPETKGYNLTVDLVDHAIADLKAGKASGKPTFLYLAFGTAHAPIQAPKAYIDRVGNRYAGGWDKLRETRFARQKQLGIIPADTVLTERSPADPAWSSLSPDQQRLYARSMAVYAAFIEQTDEQLGRLIAYLKQSGRYDNTLIILTSDNGAAAEGDADGGFWTPYHDKASMAETPGASGRDGRAGNPADLPAPLGLGGQYAVPALQGVALCRGCPRSAGHQLAGGRQGCGRDPLPTGGHHRSCPDNPRCRRR